MNPSKWNFVSVVVLSLIYTVVSESVAAGSRQQQEKHQVPMATANQSANGPPPYWEYMLREFVFKTISPPPSSNINLYKRLLDAPLYGGPFPTGSNDGGGSAVLSRGDVYYLPNSKWLLCQEGCVDCEACSEHTHPVLKWVLRRIKRQPPVYGKERQDLQLTLIPRIDGSHLLRSLWPRSHVYVTTPGDLEAFLGDRLVARQGPDDDQDTSLQPPGHQRNFWRFVERDSLPERRVLGEQSNDAGPPETHGHPGSDSNASDRENARNTTSNERARAKLPDRPTGNDSVSTTVPENPRNRSKLLLLPKLILGTDQLGQKHLVHVVPADATGAGNSTMMAALNAAGGAGRVQNRTAYQRILKRIYDSLSSNKRSIESFLDPTLLTDRQQEMYQQQETRQAGLKQLGKLHEDYKETIRNGSQRWPSALNGSRQRRKSNDGSGAETSTIDPSNDQDPDRNVNNISLSNRSNTVQNTKHGPRVFKVVVSTESTTKSLNKSDADFGRDVASSDNRFNYNSTMNTGGDPMSVSLINKP